MEQASANQVLNPDGRVALTGSDAKKREISVGGGRSRFPVIVS
jgi:hypothetical protein